MVCAQVIGNDAAVTVAGASGNFELNVMMPVIARNLLESIRLLVRLRRGCWPTAASTASPPTPSGCGSYAESSPSVVTPLNKYVGYETAAKIAKQALADGATIRETVIAMGYVERGDLTEEQLDEALDVESHDPSVSDDRSRPRAGAVRRTQPALETRTRGAGGPARTDRPASTWRCAPVRDALPTDRGRCRTCSRWAADRASSRPGCCRSAPAIALLATDQSTGSSSSRPRRGVAAHRSMDVQQLLAPDDVLRRRGGDVDALPRARPRPRARRAPPRAAARRSAAWR